MDGTEIFWVLIVVKLMSCSEKYIYGDLKESSDIVTIVYNA